MCLQLSKAEKYIKTPLIWFMWHPTGAKLSNILDYWLVATLTEVLTHNFLLLLIHLDCTTKQRSIPFGYHISICWFRALISVFSSLHNRISWWSRRQWVRRYHVWCTDILGGHFEHAPPLPDLPVSLMKLLSGKKQNFQSWDYNHQTSEHRNFAAFHIWTSSTHVP